MHNGNLLFSFSLTASEQALSESCIMHRPSRGPNGNQVRSRNHCRLLSSCGICVVTTTCQMVGEVGEVCDRKELPEPRSRTTQGGGRELEGGGYPVREEEWVRLETPSPPPPATSPLAPPHLIHRIASSLLHQLTCVLNACFCSAKVGEMWCLMHIPSRTNQAAGSCGRRPLGSQRARPGQGMPHVLAALGAWSTKQLLTHIQSFARQMRKPTGCRKKKRDLTSGSYT